MFLSHWGKKSPEAVNCKKIMKQNTEKTGKKETNILKTVFQKVFQSEFNKRKQWTEM